MDQPQDAARQPHPVSIILYGDAEPRLLDLEALARVEPAPDELLWVDLDAAPQETVEAVWQALRLDPQTRPSDPLKTQPGLWKHRGHFLARVVAVHAEPQLDFVGTVLTIVAGKDFVVTHHAGEIGFISDLKARHADALSNIGCLGEASFVAALLDWHLSTYFDAGALFEVEIERLEQGILSDKPPGRAALPRLRQLRAAASRLRRMLSPHRAVFDGLSRPDFAPDGEESAAHHLRALDDHFERAMDVVENARELVVGSFQLFSTQTELQTNERMKLLTFVTVVTGLLAVIAGALGMNFEANFFATKTTGFWVAVAFMVTLGGVAVIVGRLRKWL